MTPTLPTAVPSAVPSPLRGLTASLVAALALALTGAGCGETTPGSAPDTADPGKADSAATAPATVRGHLTGFTVTFDGAIRHETREGRPVWVATARTSKSLSDAFSFVPDDAFGTTRVLSPRKLEVVLDAHEANSVLSGLPLFISFTVAGQSRAAYHGRLQLAAALTDFSGSSKIFVLPGLRPVQSAGELAYRGRVRATGLRGLEATVKTTATPAPAAPTTVPGEDGLWNLDLSFDALAAVERGGTLELSGRDRAGRQSTKRARAAFAVSAIDLTTGDPYDVWPQAACDPAVHACLLALAGSQPDTASCGAYRAVRACELDPPPSPPAATVSPETFAADLRAHLVGYYADHGADVASAGGNTLAQAQAAVSAAAVTEVTAIDEDPEGHNLDAFIVLRHRDVVFPGSDIVWFGAYDRFTGQLERVYDFN